MEPVNFVYMTASGREEAPRKYSLAIKFGLAKLPASFYSIDF